MPRHIFPTGYSFCPRQGEHLVLKKREKNGKGMRIKLEKEMSPHKKGPPFQPTSDYECSIAPHSASTASWNHAGFSFQDSPQGLGCRDWGRGASSGREFRRLGCFCPESFLVGGGLTRGRAETFGCKARTMSSPQDWATDLSSLFLFLLNKLPSY